MNIVTQDLQEYLAPGPDGPVFGRKFEMAQFAWSPALEPPCYLFSSDEIPGPYPDYPKGWGGVNASGYANPDYDRLCREGRFTLAEMGIHAQAYQQAQAILAEQLPAIPLYWHFKGFARVPDFCGVSWRLRRWIRFGILRGLIMEKDASRSISMIACTIEISTGITAVTRMKLNDAK